MRDMIEKMNMKNKYYIELCGCDDTTPFVMELDENEVNLLQTVAQKSREVSSYSCMPRMFVKPLDECNEFELMSVGIRTDEFIWDE